MPQRDLDGSFVTPNHHLTAIETVWHLRAALNVAALNCQGGDGVTLVAAYNNMLATDRDVLARANAAVDTRYRLQFGAHWQGARETAMTRLYNFFAQPPAHDAFCAAAAQIARQVGSIDAADLPGFAVAAMLALEAPFQDFYERYAAYRDALAAWRNGSGVGSVTGIVSVATLRQR